VTILTSTSDEPPRAQLDATLLALPDDEIVARVASGESSLFEVIMRRYNQRLFRVVRSIVRDDHEAEDAVQQAYLSAYSHLRQFTGQAQFATWLTRIAINEGLARVRQRARNPVLDFEEEHESMLDSGAPRNPEDEASRREMIHMLEEAIDQLPPIYRMVFMMREVEQLSTTETAAALEIGEEATKVRLHRAKGLLRESITARVQASLADAYPFLGRRCDRIVSAVLSAIAGQPVPPA
jgi:RNA polymerase sigma-70 factor (ECF subfamily)